MSPPPSRTFRFAQLRHVLTPRSNFYHSLALTASVGADAALVPYENAVFTLFDKAGRILSWKQVRSELEAHGFGYPAEAACKEAAATHDDGRYSYERACIRTCVYGFTVYCTV